MPSTNKTPFLQLNRWIGSDKPKMEDFNADNEKVDTALQAHLVNSDIHLSAQQQAWAAEPYCLGGYVGDGSTPRAFNLGFKPKAVWVFCCDSSPCEFSTANQFTVVKFGMAADGRPSVGVTLSANGFSVINSPGTVPAGASCYRLNAEGYNYGYIAFR